MGEKTRISNRVGQFGASAIHEMTRLAQEVEDVAFLSWAKPTSGAPAHIHEAAVAAIEAGQVDGYAPAAGLPALREAIAAKLARDNGIPADPAEVLVTVGAIEGLAAAVFTALDPGDEVILPTPTYSTHIRQVELASGHPVLVPLVEDEGYRWDLDAVRAAITPRTKALLFANPSNPTGTAFDHDDLRGLVALAAEHDLLLVVDEAYEYFVFDGHEHLSVASLPGAAERTLTSFTFTKTYAMTGWRVGYLYGPRALIAAAGKAHIPLVISAPTVSQVAALAALEGSQACVREFRTHYERARDAMCERLDRVPHLFSYVRPTGSYLMFPRILVAEGADSRAFCVDLLHTARVSTTPGVAFGPTGQGHLRLSFCVPEATIHKAFDRMERRYPR